MMIKKTDRISLKYQLNFKPQEHYSAMLKDDFSQTLFSYDSEIEFEPESLSQGYINFVIELIPHSSYSLRNDLSGSFKSSVKALAEIIVRDGQVNLELVEEIDYNNVIHYKLLPFFGEKIKRSWKSIFQYIPHEAISETGPKRIAIPKNKVFILKFPNLLGGKKKYLKFLKEFERFGKKAPYLSTLKTLEDNTPHLDLKALHKRHTLEMWRKSKMIEWTHRSSTGDFFSSYYRVNRNLLFLRKKVIFRNYILTELISIVDDITKNIGYPEELRIKNFTTEKDIEEKRLKWIEGSLTIEEYKELHSNF